MLKQITKFINWLVSPTYPNDIQKLETVCASHMVFFDGDQVTFDELCSVYTDCTHRTDYIWVHIGTLPKKVSKHAIRKVKPSNFGKEATDTYIAMHMMTALYTMKYTEYTVFTNDLDFVDSIVYAANLFPNIKFRMMMSLHRATSPKVSTIRKSIPKNIEILTYRLKDKNV